MLILWFLARLLLDAFNLALKDGKKYIEEYELWTVAICHLCYFFIMFISMSVYNINKKPQELDYFNDSFQ